MKKFVPFILTVALIMLPVVGCNQTDTTTTTTSQTDTTAVADTTTGTTSATDASQTASAANTGYSIITSLKSSKSATAQEEGIAQVDLIIAMATMNPDGKLDTARIDSVMAKIPFDSKGQISKTLDINAPVPSKVELKESYGMSAASSIKKEWYQQAESLEQWVTGKSIADIKGLKVKKVDDAHPAVPDVPELTSSVTISVADIQSALEKASSNFVLGNPVASGDGHKTGMGIVTSLAKSKGATSEADGLAQVDSTVAFVSLDKDGKIANIRFDSAQVKLVIGADGVIKSDLNAPQKTKQELGAEYNLVSASNIKKEWNEQADAFAKWCIGKTIDEVKSLKTKVVDENHPQVPDIPELTSSVTISVGDFISSLEKAVTSAK